MDRKVISDTSCLIALQNINRLELLKDLYREIIITKEVQKEFGEPVILNSTLVSYNLIYSL